MNFASVYIRVSIIVCLRMYEFVDVTMNSNFERVHCQHIFHFLAQTGRIILSSAFCLPLASFSIN